MRSRSNEVIEPVQHRDLLPIPAWAQPGDVIRHEESGYEYVVCAGDPGTTHHFEWMELPSIPDFYGFPVEEDDEVGEHELRIDGDVASVTITGIGTEDEEECHGGDSCWCREDHGDNPDPHPAYVFPEVIEGTMANARAEWDRARREAAARWPRGWLQVGATEQGALDHWVGQGAGVDPAEPVGQEVAEAVGEVMDPEERPVDYIAEFVGPAGGHTPIHEGESVTDAVQRILVEQMPGVHRWQQQVIAHYVGIDVPGMIHAASISELPSGIAAVARYTPPEEPDEWAGLPVEHRRQPDGSMLHVSAALPSGSAYIMTSRELQALAQQHLDAMRRHQREMDSSLVSVPRMGFEFYPQRSRPRQTHRDRREAMDRWLSGAGWHVEDSHQVESSEADMAEKNARTELCWASLADFAPCNERAETEVGLCAYHANEMRNDGEISGVSDEGS